METDPTEMREALAAILGLTTRRASSAPTIATIEPQEGYRRARVAYPDEDGAAIPAFLLIPDGEGPFPAALVLHRDSAGHHLGKSEIAGLEGDAVHALGLALVRRGVLVLAPDIRHFEDRRTHARGTVPHPCDAAQHDNGLMHRLVRGDTLARATLDDCLQGVSLLAAHPSVERTAVGVVGHGLGGSLALFLAALDRRVRWCVASGAACSYRHKLAHGTRLEPSLVVPGIANVLDLDELLQLIAHRPTLLVSAEDDPRSADAPEMAARVQQGWPGLHHLRYPGGHDLTQQRTDAILGWVARLLKLERA